MQLKESVAVSDIHEEIREEEMKLKEIIRIEKS